MTVKRSSEQTESSVVAIVGNELATDLARRKLLLGAAWAAPLVLTIVSVNAYGAKASGGPGGGCESLDPEECP